MKHNIPPPKEEKKGRVFYGWIIVLMSFLIAAVAWGAQYSFGVMFKPILTEFGWTRAEVSGAFSLASLVLGFLGFFAGSISDRFGPRLILTVCGLCLGLGYLLLSQINAIWQIYLVYGVFIGIGMAGVWVPLVSTVARWFVKRRGLTSGIVSSGIGVGITVIPPLMSHLISQYDWRISCIVIGSIALIVFVISAQFIKRDPGCIGQLAYGADAAKQVSSNADIQGFSVKEAICTRPFWIISVAFFLFGSCVATVMVHIVPYATDMGVSASAAATILSAIGIVSIVSKVGMGSVIDRLRSKPVLIIIAILMLMAFLWLQLASALWMLYLFAAVFSISYGGTAALQSPLVAEFFKLRAHGAILGLINFILWIGSATGPHVAALMFDITGSYDSAFIVCVLLSIANVILVMLLKPARK
jgi:MFS family permease